MVEFRRRKDSQKWHFCTNCSEWPTADYVTEYGDFVPQSDEVCWECHGNDKSGNCDYDTTTSKSSDS